MRRRLADSQILDLVNIAFGIESELRTWSDPNRLGKAATAPLSWPHLHSPIPKANAAIARVSESRPQSRTSSGFALKVAVVFSLLRCLDQNVKEILPRGIVERKRIRHCRHIFEATGVNQFVERIDGRLGACIFGLLTGHRRREGRDQHYRAKENVRAFHSRRVREHGTRCILRLQRSCKKLSLSSPQSVVGSLAEA